MSQTVLARLLRLVRSRALVALLGLLVLCALSVAQRPAQASMYNLSLPGGWAGGHIGWYYNPAGRPANVTDDEVIASVNAAFAAWSKVCRVDGSYLGLTSTATSPTPTNAFVVGWVDFGSTDFEARTGTTRTGGTNFRPTTGGHIEINSLRSADIRSQLDNPMGNLFAGVLGHEVGHALGLAHSDDPNSVMFANPYNNAAYQATLEGDDIAACADLYGGQGLVNLPDLRDARITSPVAASMRTYLMGASPTTVSRPSASLPQLDGSPNGIPIYFSTTYWTSLPQGIPVYHRWVSPNGSIYYNGLVYNLAVNTGYYYSSLTNGSFKLPGRWALQMLVNGEVATNQAFEVNPPSVTPVQPFEMALLGERDAASGQFKWRAAPYGRGGVLSPAQILVNNGQSAPALNAPTLSGSNSVAFWLESDRSRYTTDDGSGQPAHSYDVVRRASFTTSAANGTLLASAPAFTESGNTPAASISAQMSLAEAHDYNIYVAILVNGQLLFRSPTGWSSALTPLVTAHGPAVANLDLIRNYDIRSLPAGTTLWVGWGRDVVDMLNTGQLALAKVF